MPRTKRGKTTREERTAIIADLEAWLSEGKTLREFCRQDAAPSWRTVYAWMDEDQDFASRIARARVIGAEAIAQECLAIADTPVIGEEVKIDPEGDMEVKRGDMLGHRKLQVETRLKLLAKWFPQRYGDKLTQEHTGPNGGPVQMDATITIVRAPGGSGGEE